MANNTILSLTQNDFVFRKFGWHAPQGPLDHAYGMGGGTFFKVEGDKCTLKKNYCKILWCDLATVTSQALKYDLITYTPYEGLKSTIFDKTTPL